MQGSIGRVQKGGPQCVDWARSRAIVALKHHVQGSDTRGKCTTEGDAEGAWRNSGLDRAAGSAEEPDMVRYR